MKQFGVGNAESVVTESTQAHHAKIFIPNRDGLGRSPFLVDLLAGAEEVHIALKGRFKQFVPVFQVGQNGQRLGRELVRAGPEYVGDFAFVHKHRHLRFAHNELTAVLNLHILHRKAPRQRAIAVFRPLNDVDKLLLNETSNRIEE